MTFVLTLKIIEFFLINTRLFLLTTVPFHTTLRVWDVFLHEGVKVLFRVGVAIMKELEPQLLQMSDFGSLFAVLTNGIDLHKKKESQDGGGGGGSGEKGSSCSRMEGDALIAMAFRLKDIGSMSTKKLVQLRRKVVQEDKSLQ